MKMDIPIQASVPVGFVLVAVAHACLAASLKAKACPDHVVLTESALAFKPRADWPKAFRFCRPYR